MKIVINKENMIIATHGNNQDIKDLYDNENLEIIRIPDDVVIEDLSNEFIDTRESNQMLLPSDPRISWSLDKIKENATKVIPDIEEEYRTKILSKMPGKIDSYDTKTILARRIIESESPNEDDLNLLKLEADSKGITPLELAEIIIKKSQEFAEISTFIDGASNEIKDKIDECKSYQEAWDQLENLEKNILEKINQIN